MPGAPPPDGRHDAGKADEGNGNFYHRIKRRFLSHCGALYFFRNTGRCVHHHKTGDQTIFAATK
jgi:hypothetical protein